jgi:hypothetical protein
MYILAMDISEMDISEMMSSKGIGIQICPFLMGSFYDKPPFLPDPFTYLSIQGLLQMLDDHDHGNRYTIRP